MTPEARRARGIAAQALLEDETIKAGWQDIENELHREWENCGRFQKRKRETLLNELRHLRALRYRLASYAGHAPRD